MNLCKYYDSTSALFISSILSYVVNVQIGGPGYEMFIIKVSPYMFPAMILKATRQPFYLEVWRPSFHSIPWVVFSMGNEELAVIL